MTIYIMLRRPGLVKILRICVFGQWFSCQIQAMAMNRAVMRPISFETVQPGKIQDKKMPIPRPKTITKRIGDNSLKNGVKGGLAFP